MAAYYHHTHGTTDIPPDHLHHTLSLMNPIFPGSGYPDAHAPPPQSLPPLHHQLVSPHEENATVYGYPQPEARDFTLSRQGLSLSLSSQTPPFGPQHDVDGDVAGGAVLGSKYLKATQELLEEVVHVGDGLLSKSTESPKKSGGGGGGDGGSGGVAQLSSAEKQELQMRKAKLINILNEAEQRYRQYHSQIQSVVTWFDQASGIGSSKTYTALALKTISKQFRCLKDAIQAQVKAASKSLGEGGELGSSAGKIEGSRLKYIDHQIRQQRAMQQFGMIQNHNAWRPQRGLPERSVSVLRAWLFEHFLHPYPKDSDKTMLAKQAGLTRSQVSNWFINARVRLWKPMIEEMYTEENKEKEQNLSEDKTSSKENSIESNSTTDHEKKINISNQNQAKGGTLKDQNPSVSSSTSPSFIPIPIPIPTPPFKGNTHTLPQTQHGFAFTGLLEMEGISQGSPKRPRINQVLHCGESNREILIKFGNDKQGKDNGYPMIPGAMNFVVGGEELESYQTIGEIGRFGTEEFPPTTRFLPGNRNGISLSLGLPPSENHTFLSPNQNIQFQRANDFGSLLNCCQTL